MHQLKTNTKHALSKILNPEFDYLKIMSSIIYNKIKDRKVHVSSIQEYTTGSIYVLLKKEIYTNNDSDEFNETKEDKNDEIKKLVKFTKKDFKEFLDLSLVTMNNAEIESLFNLFVTDNKDYFTIQEFHRFMENTYNISDSKCLWNSTCHECGIINAFVVDKVKNRREEPKTFSEDHNKRLINDFIKNLHKNSEKPSKCERSIISNGNKITIYRRQVEIHGHNYAVVKRSRELFKAHRNFQLSIKNLYFRFQYRTNQIYLVNVVMKKEITRQAQYI